MATLRFTLVTPEKTVLSEELLSLTCETTLGQVTILPEHTPLVATLVPGQLHAQGNGTDHFVYVAGGFVEVKKNNEVIVLADAAEHHYEIDIAAAEEAKLRAEKDMKERTHTTEEYARVTAALEKSLARVNIARKHAHRRKHSQE